VPQDLRDPQDLQMLPGHKVQPVPQDLADRRDRLVPQDLADRRDRLVPQDLRDPQDLQMARAVAQVDPEL